MRGNVQTVYAELNEVKKKLLQAGILSFLKDVKQFLIVSISNILVSMEIKNMNRKLKG
mgnify:FL=1